MRKLSLGSLVVLGGLVCANSLWAAPPERPTLNHTADPRPNILPDWIYNHHVAYRAIYNRPTCLVGKELYHFVSPTSQEAMAWKENYDRGYYNGKHCPPLVKGYFYLKPWEALNTYPRPTYVNSTTANLSQSPVPMNSQDEKQVEALIDPGIVGD